MSESFDSDISPSSILIVDGEIVARHAIADYLRHCGYSVIEAANIEEAFLALGEPTLTIDVVLCEVTAVGPQKCFELANWVRAYRPELEVRLVGGVETAAETAAQLCEVGPHLKRPYEPSAVVDYIKQLRASRTR
jgi:response regulator RpfG family c-di-GMP phosphodiesterase